MSLLGRFCDKCLEAGWLAAVVVSAFFMNIYTQRMFEPDKGALIRSIAILMLVTWLVKFLETGKREEPVPPAAPTVAQPSEPAPARTRWLSPANLLLLTAGLFMFSYILSTVLSVLPHNSFWGGYDRMQGLYTTTSYFVIFLIAATHIKSLTQINRLINVIILTSIPVMLYGFLQKMGQDPVPWQSMDPTARISSTMGNPIFLAAYLIMVVPLILARLVILIRESLQKDVSAWHWWKIGYYSILFILQVVAILLTSSRGPLTGLIVGLAVFILGYGLLSKNKLLLTLSVTIPIIFGAFIYLYSNPNVHIFDSSLKQISWLKRFDLRSTEGSGSVRVREILWGNAYKLMKDALHPPGQGDPYHYSKPWRFILGYGPETIGNTFYRYHTPELVGYEGTSVHADNCHDSVINTWVNQGVLGVIVFLALIFITIWAGIKCIKRLTTDPPFQLITLGVISAIIAHFVESLLGLQIVVTLTHLWLFIAVIYVISRLVNKPTVVTVPPPNNAVNTLPATGRRRDKATAKKIPLTKPVTGKSFTHFMMLSLFWTFIVITLLIIVTVVSDFWPNMETDVAAWIEGIYIYLLGSIIFGAVTLLVINEVNIPRTPPWNRIMLGSSFNLIPYALLFVLAGVLIFYTNLNPIMADAFYKFSFSADAEAQKLQNQINTCKQIKVLNQKLLNKSFLSQDEQLGLKPWLEGNPTEYAQSAPAVWEQIDKKLQFMEKFYSKPLSPEETQRLQQHGGPSLSPDEQQWLQPWLAQWLAARPYLYQNNANNIMGLQLPSIIRYQECLSRAPLEPTYLNGAGKVFMELANLRAILIQDSILAPDADKKDRLDGKVPTIEALLKFTRDADYAQFTARDLMLCCLAVIRRAYDIEPTNLERLDAMGKTYQTLGSVYPENSPERRRYFEEARKYFQDELAVAPLHPTPQKNLQQILILLNQLPQETRSGPPGPTSPPQTRSNITAPPVVSPTNVPPVTPTTTPPPSPPK